jgi:mono/diheme cytochrome c family protein
MPKWGLFAAGAVAAGVLAACQPVPEANGARLYHDYCSGCHGDDGRGDGPAAAGLARKPADLTRIAARNGGVFPRVKVMSWIDGFTRAGKHGGQVMPVFDPLLTGPDVLVDTGSGVMTPTPIQLVALADYVEGLQAPAKK